MACQANAQSILPARPEAVNGGNPFEGLGRPDDPNPSRVGDFPDLNTTPTSAADAAPLRTPHWCSPRARRVGLHEDGRASGRHR